MTQGACLSLIKFAFGPLLVTAVSSQCPVAHRISFKWIFHLGRPYSALIESSTYLANHLPAISGVPLLIL